ncbi:MAG: tetratricopeptide repeat protein [Elusimicrobia bacterium]|nr:tetratricopeptide repeat protein [Elusimicrobiota bacterium]
MADLSVVFSKDPFLALNEDHRDIFARNVKIFRFQKGQVLIRAGEFGSTVYFILEGICGVFAAGREIAQLRAGDFFGEMAILSDTKRSASVKTLSDVVVATMTASKFREIFLSDPKIVEGLDKYYKKRRSELNILRKRAEEEERKKRGGKSFFSKFRDLFKILLIFFLAVPISHSQNLETLNKIQFANGLFEDGMYELARKQFLEIVSSGASPASSEADFMQAECLFQMKKYPLAYDEFRKVYRRTSNDKIRRKAFKRMADSTYKMSQWKTAVSLYEKFLKKWGLDEEVLFFLAQSLSERKDFDSSIYYYRKLLREFKGSRFADFANYSIGFAEMSLKNFAKASAFFAKVSSPKLLAPSFFYRGVCLLKTGDFSSARDEFELVKKRFPETTWAEKASGKIAESFIVEKKYDEALKILDGIKSKSQEAFLKYLFGQVYYGKKLYAQAAIYYDEVARKFPKSEWAEKSLFSLGWCYLNMKKWASARKKFAGLILKYSKTPYFVRAQFLIGHCYYYEEEFDKAAEAYGRVIDAFPADKLVADSLFWRGMSFMKSEKWNDASRSFKILTEKYPSFSRISKAYLNLGIAEEKAGRLESSEKVFKGGIKKNFPAAEADDLFYALGNLYVKMSRFQEAVTMYEKVKTVSKIPRARLAAAGALLNGRKFEEARRRYREVMEKWSGLPVSEEAAFSIAVSFYKENKWDAAVSGFMDFVAKYPESKRIPDAYYFAGWSAFTAEKWLDAVDLWEKYFEMKKDEEVLLHIGDSYYNAGKIAAARETYAKLIAEFPSSRFVAKALYSSALVLRKSGEMENAAENLKKIIAEFPESEILKDAEFLLAEIYEEKKDFEKAYSQFLDIFGKFASDPLAVDSLYRAAVAAKKMKNYSAEREIFLKLIEKFPKSDYFEEANFRICETFFDEQNYSAAFSAALEFRKKFPGSQFAPFALDIAGKCADKLKDSGKLRGIREDIEKNYPFSPPAAEIYYKRGKSLFEKGDFDAALPELRRVTDILHDETSAEAQMMIAKCFLAKSELEQARLEFLRIVYIYPDFGDLFAEALYNVGVIYLRQGKADEAKKTFGKLIKKFPNSEFSKKAKDKIANREW